MRLKRSRKSTAYGEPRRAHGVSANNESARAPVYLLFVRRAFGQPVSPRAIMCASYSETYFIVSVLFVVFVLLRDERRTKEEGDEKNSRRVKINRDLMSAGRDISISKWRVQAINTPSDDISGGKRNAISRHHSTGRTRAREKEESARLNYSRRP